MTKHNENPAVLSDIVQQCKNLTRKDVYKTIENLSENISANLFWFDENNIFIGANKQNIKAIGADSAAEFVGKTPYEYFPLDMAEVIVKHNSLVMKTGELLSQEETIREINTGVLKYFTTFKAPLHDNKGNNIGVLCVAVDITEKIKVGCLEQDQAKFSTLASFDLMPAMSLDSINYDVYRKMAYTAQNLLQRCKKPDAEIIADVRQLQSILVSFALATAVNKKRIQYSGYLINICDFYDTGSAIAFIKTDKSNFIRMISNLIDNAFDAFEDKSKGGLIDLRLVVDDEVVKIIVLDNAICMFQNTIDKVMNKESNGIGLTQVRGALNISGGKMEIKSEIGKGTEITLTFPRERAPFWIADKISLYKGDTVVILDDDPCVHEAWDICLGDYEKEGIYIEHFEFAEEAIEFIDTFSDKRHLCLLTDIELSGQELSGLKVIEKTSTAQRAILVTNQYNREDIVAIAIENRLKVLPKQLVAATPVKIIDIGDTNFTAKKTELVIIDDREEFADYFADFFQSRDLSTDVFYSPDHFLKALSQYDDKSIKICIDYDLGCSINGIGLAKQLNEMGFTKLYLLASEYFNKNDAPSYLTVLLKSDMDLIDKVISGK